MAVAASGVLGGLLRRHLSVHPATCRGFRIMASKPQQQQQPTQPQPNSLPAYETLKLERVREKVLHVELNCPEKRNAMNTAFWREMVECFNNIGQDSECRAVVISGAGKLFTSGIDLMEMGSVFLMAEGDDVARKAWNIRKMIRDYQESFTVLEKCPKPVIAAVHGACIGGGVDLITACDIRYCTQDAWFQVKEVDIGLAADVGTLQRLPRIIGNRSLVNELAFTARKLMAPEAESCGLVSRVFRDHETMLQSAFDLATEIASKSPIAVQGTKLNLVYARDHSVPDSLKYMVGFLRDAFHVTSGGGAQAPSSLTIALVWLFCNNVDLALPGRQEEGLQAGPGVSNLGNFGPGGLRLPEFPSQLWELKSARLGVARVGDPCSKLNRAI